MPLGLTDQFEVARNAWVSGDFDLFQKVWTAPDAVTPEETRSVAEMLGIKGGWLAATTNLVTDPLVLFSFYLDRKFPVSQYLRGVTPQRFIGAANEFTGLSSLGRTTVGFFRGTNVPKLTSLVMRRQAEVMNVGNRLFNRILERPNWKNEMPTVSLLLEGQNPQGATPELRDFAKFIREGMDELWGFLERSHKVEGGLFESAAITRASSRPFTTSERPRYLRDYLPHMPLVDNDAVMTVSGSDAIRRLANSPAKQAMVLSGENPADVWRRTAGDRLTAQWGSFQRLMERTNAQVFNSRLFHRHRMGLNLQSAEGAGLFVTDLNVILQKYLHGVARTYALNAPLSAHERAITASLVEGAGGAVRRIAPSDAPPVVQIVNEGLDAAGTAVTRQERIRGTDIVKEIVDTRSLNAPTLGALKTLVKDVKGLSGTNEVMFGNVFSAIREKVRRIRNPGVAAQAEDALGILERQDFDRKVMSGLTSYLYGTTLGLNFGSAAKNLMQPFLTTMPAIGFGPTIQGFRVLRDRLPSYGRSFIDEYRLLSANPRIPKLESLNLSTERAFNKTFPELAATGIKADPRLFELSEQEIGNLATVARGGKLDQAFRANDAFSRFLLQPFTNAEMANQVVTFYGGKQALRQAIRRGEMDIPIAPDGTRSTVAQVDDFLNFEAANIVAATQFRPGPGSRTVLQSVLPGPVKMFTSFPTRLANYFVESTVRGAMTQQQLADANLLTRLTGGRNWGTVARSVLLGRVINEGFNQVLGIDMSDALGVTGPFTNVLNSGNMLGPLGVAPLPSALYGVASFAATRDIKRLQPLTLPWVGEVPFPKSLVPAGISISRAARAVNMFRPDLGGFVDEEERLMYQGDATDAFLSAVGIPLAKQRRFQEQIQRMADIRLRIRKYRREYARAYRNHEYTRMEELQQSYGKEFEGFGPLAVSQHDLRRYNETSRLTAAQRMLSTLGSRAAFLEERLFEIDPDLVVQPGEQVIGQ